MLVAMYFCYFQTIMLLLIALLMFLIMCLLLFMFFESIYVNTLKKVNTFKRRAVRAKATSCCLGLLAYQHVATSWFDIMHITTRCFCNKHFSEKEIFWNLININKISWQLNTFKDTVATASRHSIYIPSPAM